MSHEPDNIKAFNYIVLAVLTKLYENFPEPTDCKGLRFVIETVLEKGTEAAETRYAHLFRYVLPWLRDEGFVKFESETSSGEFEGVSLTLRGLTILGYVPRSIFGEKKTLAQRAKLVIGKGIDQAASGVVQSIIGDALRLMIRSSLTP